MKRERSKSEGNYPESVSTEKKETEGMTERKTAKLSSKATPNYKQESLKSKHDESRIPTRNSKKIVNESAKKLEHTLHQMGTLKTRLRLELKSRSKPHPIEELKMDELNFNDENEIREKMMEIHRNNIMLKKQVTELNSHNATLQNRLLKEQEKGKLNPKISTCISSSVQVCVFIFKFRRICIFDINFRKILKKRERNTQNCYMKTNALF